MQGKTSGSKPKPHRSDDKSIISHLLWEVNTFWRYFMNFKSFASYELEKSMSLLSIGMTKQLNEEQYDAIMRAAYSFLGNVKKILEKEAAIA
jgi:hypothetical protein